jgi:hypothetical protein
VARWNICWVEKSKFSACRTLKNLSPPPLPNPCRVHGSLPRNVENTETSFWTPKSPSHVYFTLSYRAHSEGKTDKLHFPCFISRFHYVRPHFPSQSNIQHKRNGGNISKSKLLYDWRFTANKFVLVPNSLRCTTWDFFSTWALTVTVLMLTSPLTREWVCLVWIGFAFIMRTYHTYSIL